MGGYSKIWGKDVDFQGGQCKKKENCRGGSWWNQLEISGWSTKKIKISSTRVQLFSGKAQFWLQFPFILVSYSNDYVSLRWDETNDNKAMIFTQKLSLEQLDVEHYKISSERMTYAGNGSGMLTLLTWYLYCGL